MSSPSDRPETAAPESALPKDPADYRPRPLLGVTFWAMIALMLLCVLAGVAIAEWGPRIFGVRPPLHPAAAEPAPVASGT